MNHKNENTIGKIVGLGVGPGDPELLTLKAINYLKTASVVIVPKAKNETKSIALTIAETHIQPDCEIASFLFPMTEDEEVKASAWKEAAQFTIEKARSGANIAFLTLGDPSFYSTWTYFARTLRELDSNVLLQVIPGITAMTACAARLGLPLAEGREPLLVVPGGLPDDETLHNKNLRFAFLKAGAHLAALVDWAEPRHVTLAGVHRCGFPEEEVTTSLNDWVGSNRYLTTVLGSSRSKK